MSGIHLGREVKEVKEKISLLLQTGKLFVNLSRSSLTKELIFSFANSLLSSRDSSILNSSISPFKYLLTSSKIFSTSSCTHSSGATFLSASVIFSSGISIPIGKSNFSPIVWETFGPMTSSYKIEYASFFANKIFVSVSEFSIIGLRMSLIVKVSESFVAYGVMEDKVSSIWLLIQSSGITFCKNSDNSSLVNSSPKGNSCLSNVVSIYGSIPLSNRRL